MKSLAEKMRQMRARLKSASGLVRRTAASGAREAAIALKKARQMPSDWLASRGSIAAAPIVADGWSVAPNAATPLPERQPALTGGGAGWRDRFPGLAKILKYAAIAVVIWLALPYPLMLIYRFIDPPISAMMLRNVLLGRGLDQTWVDFRDISPHLARAVVISEDAAFCRHSGVDWNAVGEALDDLEDGEKPRGASTLPMQTAKNLFLWPGQSYLRKALEVPLAYFMSLVWPKQRVVEVYLNVAEWGPGIYGAEAAARHHFGVSAASLTHSEAALLAAALPSPRKRNAGRPSARMQNIASRIEGRVDREAADAACIFDRRASPRKVAFPVFEKTMRSQETRTMHWPKPADIIIRAPETSAPVAVQRYSVDGLAGGFRLGRALAHFEVVTDGSSKTKSIPDEARHPPLGRRSQRAHLCRRQGVR